MNIKGFVTKNGNLIAEIETTIGVDYAYLSMPKLKVVGDAEPQDFEWAKTWQATEAIITPSVVTQKALTRDILNRRISGREPLGFWHSHSYRRIKALIAEFAATKPARMHNGAFSWEVTIEANDFYVDVTRTEDGPCPAHWPSFNCNAIIMGYLEKGALVFRGPLGELLTFS